MTSVECVRYGGGGEILREGRMYIWKSKDMGTSVSLGVENGVSTESKVVIEVGRAVDVTNRDFNKSY